jgi:NADPH:quinone reductase
MFAIRQQDFGGPETLSYEQVEDPEPAGGQVRIVMAAAGVHLVDTTIRIGIGGGPFPVPALPMTPGREMAGTVEVVGPGVDASWIGRRVVVHLGMASGGYAEKAVAAVSDLFTLPDGVAFTDAVAMVGTGRTAMAILDVAAIAADDVVVITAAAGGIGALLVQAGRTAGATVVGLAGGPAKIGVVEGLGADAAFDYAEPDWPARVKTWLGDRRISLGLDGVGGPIGRNVLDLIGPGGRLVMFGYSSGEMLPMSTGDLYATGVTVTAAIGARMMSRPEGIRAYARDALEELAAGRLTPLVHEPFPLAKASEAHRALESRATTGKVVLVP